MKFQSIQALRGLAALLVVFYHAQALQFQAGLAVGGTGLSATTGAFANGYAGVDLFFVISGFVMVWVTRNSPGGPSGTAEFLFARITRIYPLWWAAALLAALYYGLVHTPGPGAAAWQAELQAGQGWEHLVKSFLLIPQTHFPVLGIGWTLIHEMYFYAVFALFVLLRRAWLPVFLLVWAGLVITVSALGHGHHEPRSYLALAVHPLTLEFILGAFAALLLNTGRSFRPGLLASLAVVWLVAALALMPQPDPFILTWGRVAGYGLPSALLVYAFAGLDREARFTPLLPAAAAFLAGAAVLQLTGSGPASPEAARLTAAGIAGAAALGAALAGGLLIRVLPASTPAAPARRVMAALVRAGDWSYSIYLGHLFVIGAVQAVFARLAMADSLAPVFRAGHAGPLDDVVYYTVILTGSLIAGWAGYTLVERPALALSGRARGALFGARPNAPTVAAEPR